MTKADIIRMAQEAGWPKATLDVIVDTEMERLERFAELVAAAEREECAKVCEGMYTNGDGAEGWLAHAAAYIRARRQA